MNIFVTGAAGLLGGALVAELLRRGHGVVGLVHRSPDIRDNAGQAIAAVPFDGRMPGPGHAATVNGDLSSPGLGIDAELVRSLNSRLDLAIHCAALVKFEADARELEAVNVAGTGNLLAALPGPRFIHVSTAYVCGLRNGVIAEADCDPNAEFGNAYEQSKASAEAVVRRLRPDAVIARPSIIVGEQATGRIRSFDTIYRAFKFIAEGRIARVPVSRDASLNFVPIDHVVGGICDIAESGRNAPPVVHLAAQRAVAASDFLDLIGRIPGLKNPTVVAPANRSANRDPKRAGLAERLVQPYWGYFGRCPEFETRALSSFSDRAAPEVDDAVLLRQIQYCRDAGFIRSRSRLSQD